MQHRSRWNLYFSTSTIHIPDQDLQYLYDVSRYVARSNLHPDSGLIGLGLLPNLWGGGVYDTYDAWFSHMAFLTSGNKTESNKYLQSFVSTAHIGRDTLSVIGFPGTAFSGWADCYGGFLGHLDFTQWVTSLKPCYVAYMIIAAYCQWQYFPEHLTDEVKSVIREVIAFLRAAVIVEEDERTCIRDVLASTEAGFTVSIDTFTQLVMARAFQQAGEMLADTELSIIGSRLMDGLSANYRLDGVLMPFADAPYTGGMQTDYFLLSLPNPIDIKSVDETLRSGSTYWGTNFDQTTEEYRHWPWIDSRAVICYAHAQLPQKAMQYLSHMNYGCSSLGAIPEKLRLDGSAVCYWYSSAHALVVWAINDAFAFSDKSDSLMLAWGMTPPWHSFDCLGLHLPIAVSVSYCINNGCLSKISIQNNTEETRILHLLLNPVYDMNGSPVEVQISGHGVFNWEKQG